LKVISIIFFLLISVSYAQPAYVFFEKAEEAFNNQAWATALKNLDDCLAKDSKHARAFALRAEIKLNQNKVDDALKDLNQSLQLNAKNESALLLRAKILTDKKDFKQAETDLQKALEINPKNTNAFYQKGKLNLELKNINEAEKDFIKASENKCKIGDNYYQLFLITKNKKTSTTNQTDLLNKAIEYAPNNGLFYFERGVLLKSLNKHAEAVADFNQAEAKKFQQYELYQMRYLSLLQTGKKEETLLDLNKLINTYKSKECNHYTTRAQLLIEKGNLTDASKDINKAITLEKNNAEIYLSRARLSMAQKKNTTVLPDLNKAIELGIKNPEAFALRADLFFKQKKFNEALADYTSALKFKEDANCLYERSKCYYELKNQKAACADITRAAELEHQQAKKNINYVCK